METLKFFYRDENSTRFRVFRDYFFLLLDLVGFNLIRQTAVSVLAKARRIFLVGLLTIGVASAASVVYRYVHDIEEVIMGIITLIMPFQVVCKMLELMMHHENHSEMIKTIEKNTEDLKEDSKFHEVGVRNFKRAKQYVVLATVVYLAALASLLLYPLYPLITRGDYKLGSNVEIPGTNFKTLTGWLVNYIFSIMLTSYACILIIGNFALPISTVRAFSMEISLPSLRLNFHILRFLHHRSL